MSCAACHHKEAIPRSGRILCLLTGREESRTFHCGDFEVIKPHSDEASDEELDFDDGLRPV